MIQALVFGFFALVLSGADAQDLPAGVIYQQGLMPVSLESALSQVGPGQIVVLGEEHGAMPIADQQVQVLETLRNKGLKVSVGMEFFAYPYQDVVDSWRQGQIPEDEFLKKIEWGMGFPFAAYKRQALFPSSQETVLALNAPRTLTGKISKMGINSLSAEEKALLPPGWTRGNERYFKRFQKIMGDHLPNPAAVENYFDAQSTWDDTMAWKATEFLKSHPEDVLVIVVGEFHVQYGGGLPDRLRARGAKVITFSQVNLEGLSDVEQREAVQPSSSEGPRSDFVWTSRFTRD